jgi:hypothetical protein
LFQKESERIEGQVVLYEFNETIDKQIDKSVKATLKFYNELRKASIINGEPRLPLSFETFAEMAAGLIKANKELHLDRVREPSRGSRLVYIMRQANSASG